MDEDRERTERIPLAHLPTPLEPLPRLSAALGGPTIWVKRDDCTGLAGGGNKARKLEYLLADAVTAGADVVLTAGSLQSNHARQTAGACAKLGLPCELVLAKPPFDGYLGPQASGGNVLLDRVLGATMRLVEADADLEAELRRRAAALAGTNRRPYVIPPGGSNAIGAQGYVDCAYELQAQAQELRLRIDAVVLADGSCGTHAGLALGLADVAPRTAVLGISVSLLADKCHGEVERVGQLLAQRRGPPSRRPAYHGEIDDRFIGEGYGVPSREGLAAIDLVARLEGLLLDPIYTAKAMAALIRHIEEGRFREDDNVVFLHTGGAIALLAYESWFR